MRRAATATTTGWAWAAAWGAGPRWATRKGWEGGKEGCAAVSLDLLEHSFSDDVCEGKLQVAAYGHGLAFVDENIENSSVHSRQQDSNSIGPPTGGIFHTVVDKS